MGHKIQVLTVVKGRSSVLGVGGRPAGFFLEVKSKEALGASRG